MKKSTAFKTRIVALGLAAVACAPYAEAKRTVDLPVLKFSSFHGGIMPRADGTLATCTAIGMLKGENYSAGSGVKWANHSWQVSFKNLSNVNQTVRLILLPGTQITHQNSGGANEVTNGIVSQRVARELSEPHTQTRVIGPYGDAEMGASMISGANVGYIAPADSYDSNTCGAQPEHVCMTATSTFIARIEVEEDRGAIVANVTSGGHRCYGFLDHFSTPPANFNVNGGRPF